MLEIYNLTFVLKGLYSKIIEIENSNRKAVLCTVISSKGSTPRKMGSKMIVFENETIFGSIGGGALEKKVIEQAIEVIKSKKSIVVSHNLVKELEMCCGGTVELFLEQIMNKKKLHIFGAGHIGKSLAKFAFELDFIVSLIDERIDAFDEFDVACTKINQQHTTAIENLTFDENTFVAILTHDHAYDREILALCSKKKNAYIGMVGSERKVEIAKKNLLSVDLLSQEEIEKVDMPIGKNIHAITPEEIAISILAKLIEVRNT
ncbi:MAG: XdhC family protein [Bacteroidota bacterium]